MRTGKPKPSWVVLGYPRYDREGLPFGFHPETEPGKKGTPVGEDHV